MSNSKAPEKALQGTTIPPERLSRLTGTGLALMAAGIVVCLIALLTEGGRSSIGFAYLWGFAFFWVIVLGSLFFVALQHVTRSIWSVVIRRVAEMFAAPMWIAAILFIPVLLFIWFGDQIPLFAWLDPDHPAALHITGFKKAYLNLPFFIARAVSFFIIWIFFARYFVSRSLKLEVTDSADSLADGMRRAAGPFIPIFALTATFASFDWFMSLDPTWVSTIYGVYLFAGMTASALSVITIGVVWLRSRGHLGQGIVTDEHLYSLGGLIFAFVCFWAYIAFSQFMLIWYGNIPEETNWFVHRIDGNWLTASILLPILRFALPFLLLLSRPAKTNPRRLVIVSVLVLVGELYDLYWLIMPERSAPASVSAWVAIGPLALMVGVIIWSAARFLKKHRTMAVGDPMFEESRRFHL
ncbi:hypothetical protein ACFLU6_03030 [Acidobacteriota bacterium]